VHATVGRGELPVRDVIRAVVPDAELASEPAPRKRNRRERGQGEEGWFNLSKVFNLKFRWPGSGSGEARQTQVLPIRGLRNDVPVTFEEGGAVPGDRIVGILTPGEAITIYTIQSSALADFEDRPELWLDVRWDLESNRAERYPARLMILSINEPGTLAQIAQVVAETDGNIDNLTMHRRSSDMTEMIMDVEVYDLKHLSAIIDGLRARKVVSEVQRML